MAERYFYKYRSFCDLTVLTRIYMKRRDWIFRQNKKYEILSVYRIAFLAFMVYNFYDIISIWGEIRRFLCAAGLFLPDKFLIGGNYNGIF